MAIPENWHESFIEHLASVLKPATYVELGLYHCDLFNRIVHHAQTLVGVDVNPEAGKFMSSSKKATFVNSTTEDFASALRANPISIDMLFIDADHCKESVLKDFWNFLPFVNDHGIILLHDTYPKNLQYTDKGYCGDAYLAIEELKSLSDEFEMMTIPIHPGLTLIRKRKTQLSWENESNVSTIITDRYYDRNVNKSITMPAFVSKVKQMFKSESDIKTIVEIGALDAQDSQYFKKIFPTAKVYAIEALPDNYDKYLKNLKDIACINAVVSNIDGEIAFYKKEINGIHSIFNRGNEYGNEVIKLPSYRFETLAEMNGINSVDMLKMDVEGATIEALEGMGDLLSTVKIMHLESESYPFFEGQKIHTEVVKYLEEKGFSVIELTSFPIQPGRLQYDSVWINNTYLNNKEASKIIKVNHEENSTPHYKIICIAQIYNELRKGNLERFVKHVKPLVDELVVYDDGSTDGSCELLQQHTSHIIRGTRNNFINEIAHKQKLLNEALLLNPDFILWLDADEVLTANAEEALQELCSSCVKQNADGVSFQELNLWRSHSWRRLDNRYDDGWFVRLWRVTPELMFTQTKEGLHQQQHPSSIRNVIKSSEIKVIHYGFASDRSLAYKYLAYKSHGQTGWALDRLLDETSLEVQQVPKELFPPNLWVDDEAPRRRTFSEALANVEQFRPSVFQPGVSIICLIYKSVEWLEFVYRQVLRYTDLQNKEFFFVANDPSEEVVQYLRDHYIPHHIWNNSPEQKTEWYINNVYRAWNYGAKMAKGDYLLFINSDMAFTPGWFDRLYESIDGRNCVTSRLVESGKLLSGQYAISKNFGRTIKEYNEEGFLGYADSIKEHGAHEGGLFMPLLIRKDHFQDVGGYPEGNIVPGSDVKNPTIAKKGEPCVSGDVVLMEKLKSQGIKHQTALGSVVYHFQCGEMDEKEIPAALTEDPKVVVCNDYLGGRMGEKTMWGFLLELLPSTTGVDMTVVGTEGDFAVNAHDYIRAQHSQSTIILQNASFIDMIDDSRLTVAYLQDNLRAMLRTSVQQEQNLRNAHLLVTNSRLTARSYPEYEFEIIPIGVDGQLFRPMDKRALRKEFDFPDQRIGIFVGDFSEVKGWQKVKKIVDARKDLFWILVSKDTKDYQAPHCKTYNRINQPLLAKLLNCADFFILGSPVETQCLAAIEACMCDIPVIMHNTGIFADFSEEERRRVGIFGEQFEVAIDSIVTGSYTPRRMMFEKGLTVEGMRDRWIKVLERASMKIALDAVSHQIGAMGKPHVVNSEVSQREKLEEHSLLSHTSILRWNFSSSLSTIEHHLHIQCAFCGKKFQRRFSFGFVQQPSVEHVVCPSCSVSYNFSDSQLAEYFIERMPPFAAAKPHRVPKIAVVMRYSQIIGGGVKMVFKHATWLSKLGCDVTIYSDSPAPTWTTAPGKFVQVKDHYDVPKKEYDIVIVMCIQDVPKLLTKYPTERIAHFCQGYEGYHVGNDYNELRLDKYFYTQLHSLPVHSIVVSKHLVELFAEKFGRRSYYIPNGVDLSVFHPTLSARKEPYSLLFIGNPNDPLKGIVFLIRTLEEIQKSQFKIDGLVLHVVWGGGGKGVTTKVVPMPGFQVTYHEGLTSKEVAQLINQVEVVVNTSWYEGFSLPVLEAMACGTPVITTNNMGAESFCIDGVNSFVVRYADMNRLGNIIIELLNHTIDVSETVKRGLDTARQYSEEKSLRRFIASYEELLGRSFPKERVESLLESINTSLKVPVQANGAEEQTASRQQGPLFSVMVPTYNQAHYLPYALNSLRAQTYQNWEAIVVDDGSTDNTRKVIERYAALDKRIRCVHKSNGGVASALNEALKHAKGEWIFWLSTDDLFEPEKLSIHEEEIIKYPDVKFFYTHFYVLDESTSQKLAGDPDLVKFQPSYTDSVISFFYTNYVNGISICIHRSVFEKVKGFDEKLHHGQDFDLWLRISALYTSKFINRRTCITRVHSGQGTSIFPEAGIFDSARACVEFLNTHSFTDLFPHSNFSDKKQLYRAIEKVLAIAGDPKAFINRLGYANVLLDRFHEWCSQSCPQALRKELHAQISNIIAGALTSDIPERIKCAFAALQSAGEDNFVYQPYNPLAEAERFMNELRSQGQTQDASLIKKYLDMRRTKESKQAKFRVLLREAYELSKAKQLEEALSAIAESQAEYEKTSVFDASFEVDLFNLRGACYLSLNDLVNAQCAFEETLKINPNSSEACVGLGNVFYLGEMDNESKMMFEWGVKNDPNNQAAVEGLIKINTQLGLDPTHSSLEQPSTVEEPVTVEASA